MGDVPAGITARIAELFPGGRVTRAEALGPDRSKRGATAKAEGYGLPQRIEVVDAYGRRHDLVFRTQSANDFGHDRRADRAAGALLAYDTFNRIPKHVRALDVGAVMPDGTLRSVSGGGEIYLITTYAPGRPYADDLRRIAEARHVSALDLDRCAALARYLVGLHAQRGGRPPIYTRSVRDLVGSGEGIFGIIDGYPDDTPAAPPERLQGIERKCLDWRWRLRARGDRLATIHGDFHPFNVLFGEGTELSVLDASRGCAGDPADDVTAMAVNFIFFALERPSSWATGLGMLWRAFWHDYLSESDDRELLRYAAPYFAWRGLVVANPRFYPNLATRARDRLLGFIERMLDAPELDPSAADDLFP